MKTSISLKGSNPLLYALVTAGICSLPSMAGPVPPTPATFGQGLEQNGGQDFQLVDTGTGVTLTASSQIFFVFSNVTGTLPPGLSGPLSATLTFNLASTTKDVFNAGTGTITQGGFTGTFSVTLNTPVNGHTNLLSGSVTSSANATLTGKSGGTGASLSASTPPPGAVNYTSDFAQFININTEAFSLALSSVIPSFVDNGSGFLAPFTAAGSETFSSDPPPTVVVGTPEPISMLLIGFGMMLIGAVGYRMRRSAV